MSPLTRWLAGLTAAVLLLLSYGSVHAQDLPWFPPHKSSPVTDRIRQLERAAIDEELARSAAPQIALYNHAFKGAVSTTGGGYVFTPGNPRTAIYTFTMPAHISIFVAEVMATTAEDLDLYIGIDANQDGQGDFSEVICYSISSYVLDWCSLRRPEAGAYWVLVNNYRGSAAPSDSFRVDLTGFGAEVSFSSSADLDDGVYASVGDLITFQVEVQPPLPRTAPLTYTLASSLAAGLDRVPPPALHPARTPAEDPIIWSVVTHGEAVSMTFQARVNEQVPVDTPLASEIAYSAGNERHGTVTTNLHVMGVVLVISATTPPTAPMGSSAPFTVTVTNQGVRAAEHLTVTAGLPAGVEHVAGGLLQDERLHWWLDRLEVGASVELTFTVGLPPAAASSRQTPPPAPRIVGGAEAEPGAWPWQVALWDMEYDNWWGCGGSLIGRGWVLTAAHCVTSYSYVVPANVIGAAVGRHNLHSDEGVILGVAEVLVHPQFNYFTGEYDAALLRLEASAPLSDHIALAALASVGDAALYAPGAAAVTTGWGTRQYGTYDFPEGLHQVEMAMYGDAVCEADYAAIYGTDVIYPSMICAGVPQGGKDACQGDSGGPLVVRDGNGGWRQVGVVSWGYGCGAPDAPGIYSRIPSFIDWIRQEQRVVRLLDYAVTDGSGLPGHSATGAAPAMTVFTDVFSFTWVPVLFANGDSEQ